MYNQNIASLLSQRQLTPGSGGRQIQVKLKTAINTIMFEKPFKCHTLSHNGGIGWDHDLVLSGNTLASGQVHGGINIWDVQSKKCEKKLSSNSGAAHNKLAIDGNKLVSCSGNGMLLNIWDIATSKNISYSDSSPTLDIDIFGNLVAWICMDKTIKILDLCSNKSTSIPRYDHLGCVAISDRKLVLGYRSGTVEIIDFTSGNVISISAHDKQVMNIVISDGVVATCGMDGTIKTWLLSTGMHLKTFEGHTFYVNSVAISENILVSGSTDYTIKIWDLNTGSCLNTLNHGDAVISVAISDTATGNYTIASGNCRDGIKIWQPVA